MLSDVDMDALTVQSELPLDWGACVKLLGHTRFVSRLLKLTRGTLKVTLVSLCLRSSSTDLKVAVKMCDRYRMWCTRSFSEG